MLKNGIMKTFALLAVVGVAACTQDTVEIPAEEPAAESPAVAPEAQPVETFEADTAIVDTAIVEGEAETGTTY
jgi:hypothetical protein